MANEDLKRLRGLRNTGKPEAERNVGVKGGVANFDVATDAPKRSDAADIWAKATGIEDFDPVSLADTRGKVVSPAIDRRLTPDHRAKAVMLERNCSYEEAVQIVVDAMRLEEEI